MEAARAMGPLLSAIGSNFVTPEAAAELEALFAAHSCVIPPALTAFRPPEIPTNSGIVQLYGM